MEFLLNIVLFLPSIGALVLKVVSDKYLKSFVFVISILECALVAWIWGLFDAEDTFQFITHFSLIPSFGISYFIGIDGISLVMVALSAFIVLICVIFADRIPHIKNFFVSLLFLESIMIGVFVALDMMLFYLFWEFSLVPMLYIIGAWGGEKRVYASVKFFLYTFCASLVMLFGILYLAYLFYAQTGEWSFNVLDWYILQLDFNAQRVLFWAFFIGIAVKVPMFPLHTWLPYAHGQAPTIGSMVLAAILLKMGSYAFVRFSLPLFPDASIYFVLPVAILCVIMVIYTAMIAFAQDDMKQVIAYSSISHMGIIVLGTFSMSVEGIVGSVFFMISHGIVSGALFMMVGMLYERTHTKLIAKYGGVARAMPRFTLCFAIVLMGSIGLPLTIGFVGEFLSLLGFFSVSAPITLLAGSGIIFGAVYMLNLFRNVFLGEAHSESHALSDINKREIIALVPLVAVVLWLGIYPKPILEVIDYPVKNLVYFMHEKALLDESKAFLIKVNRSE